VQCLNTGYWTTSPSSPCNGKLETVVVTDSERWLTAVRRVGVPLLQHRMTALHPMQCSTVQDQLCRACERLQPLALLQSLWPGMWARDRLLGLAFPAQLNLCRMCFWQLSVQSNITSGHDVAAAATAGTADPPPTCSGLPGANPAYGSWPSSCAGIYANQVCTATCSYGGTVTVNCQSDGSWSSTVVGSCTRKYKEACMQMLPTPTHWRHRCAMPTPVCASIILHPDCIAARC
jgi:hypothetical protein